MAFNKTRLWAVLSAIPQKDQKQVQRFVKGDSKAENSEIGVLLYTLFRYINAQKCPSRPKLWAKIAHEEPYNAVKLRRTCSDLLHRVENWLILQQLDSQVWEREKLLCSYFTKESSAKLGLFYQNATILAKKKYIYRNVTYYYEVLLEDEMNLALQLMVDTPIFDLQTVDNNLTVAFVLGKLKNSVFAYWGTLAGGKALEDILLKSIIPHIPDNEVLKANPSIQLYYHLYLLFVENKVEYFDVVKTELKAITFLHRDELSDIYSMLENYINMGIQRKIFTYSNLTAWYVQSDNQAVFTDDKGVIASTRLQGCINAHLFTAQYDKALYFLKKYKNNIVEDEREDLYNLNLGHIYFYQKKYKQALRLIATISPKRPISYLLAQRILLKTYFLEKEHDVIETALDNFQHYLYTTKRTIPEHNRLGNLYFVKTLRRIEKAQSLNRPARQPLIKKIREVVEGPNFVSERVWLAEQLSAIL
ncbi:MAG: hypothetical protein RI894_1142 [Bacteroidota bacterium]|jgi:hypothetical protein